MYLKLFTFCNLRRKFFISLVVVFILSIYSNQDLLFAEERKVLHGWGQSLGNFKKEGIAYIDAVGYAPVVISDYINIKQIKNNPKLLQHAEKIHKGFKNPKTGVSYQFMPLICLTHLSEKDYRRKIFKECIQELAKEDNEFKRIAKDKEEDRFKKVTQDDELWQKLCEKLSSKGFEFADLEIIDGKYDSEIAALAEAIKKINGIVYIRFLQESIGGIHRLDIYSAETFKKAWIHFVGIMRENGADNAQFVFHPNEGSPEALNKWWPGDSYVDWVAGSFFKAEHKKRCQGEHDFAKLHYKPYMIAESAPTQGESQTQGTEDPTQWDMWFVPFFDFIHKNDNLKIFVYISLDWRKSGRFSQWPDTRIWSNSEILGRYKKELGDTVYYHNLSLD